MGSDAKEIVRREGRSLELPSKRGLRFVMVVCDARTTGTLQ